MLKLRDFWFLKLRHEKPLVSLKIHLTFLNFINLILKLRGITFVSRSILQVLILDKLLFKVIELFIESEYFLLSFLILKDHLLILDFEFLNHFVVLKFCIILGSPLTDEL